MFIELKTADTQGAFKKVNRAEWHLMARGMEVLFMKAEKSMCQWQGHKLGNSP
jgi:hypothetical protein